MSNTSNTSNRKLLSQHNYRSNIINLIRESSDMNYLWLWANHYSSRKLRGELRVRAGVGDRIDKRLLLPFCSVLAEWTGDNQEDVARQITDWLTEQRLWITSVNDITIFEGWLVSSDEAGLDVYEGKRLKKKGDKILLNNEQVGQIGNGVMLFNQNIKIASFIGIAAGTIAIKGKLIKC